ncbi:GGDEF domain-containing protein [Psychromonas ossibalaenae]|uniref:GGDEF domain-containing protein n=1 Tax=Psychromonas ossibalaenae TaxID=444922 RepID=UPI0003709C56|nr:GGDEF domain-containing protein [Psychromonas ossibalaenae]
MSKDLMVKSAAILKKAVPLMMKYQVPTTPLNYALWYTYVSNDIPELNTKLENLMASHDVCPPIQAESLYREFVSDKTESSTWELRQSVEQMLQQLDQSLTDTHSDTSKFQQAFDKTLTDINRVEDEGWSIDEVVILLKKLEADSKDMHRSTQFFSNSLNSAKGEIASLKVQLQKSQKQALYDSLTGLLNRHAFNTELSAFLQEESSGLCMILTDIDHFKNFNDEWGHLLGDQVLKAVGRKLNDSMRDGAAAYRFGGEEFVILLPKSNLRIARHFAETIRKSFEKLSLKDKRTAKTINSITASFGVVEFQKDESLSSFIARADDYLYEAKRLGRNRVLPILS